MIFIFAILLSAKLPFKNKDYKLGQAYTSDIIGSINILFAKLM